ncbi:MAG: VanZ family protein [Patescibacteria group bacterium]
MIFIFLLSSIPDAKVEALGSWDFLLRKIAHAVLFGVLAVLISKSWKASSRRVLPWKQGIWIFGFTVFYAASDELHQVFVSGRYGTFVDVAIDSIGAFAGVFGVTRRR